MKQTKVNSRIDRIVKMIVVDFQGRVLEVRKSIISAKTVGTEMVIRLMELFGITHEDIKDKQLKMLKEEMQFQPIKPESVNL